MATATAASEGWLHKKGAVRHNWTRRWHTLDLETSVVRYYKSASDTKKALGEYCVKGAKLTVKGRDAKYANLFAIDCPADPKDKKSKRRTHDVYAENADDLEKWLGWYERAGCEIFYAEKDKGKDAGAAAAADADADAGSGKAEAASGGAAAAASPPLQGAFDGEQWLKVRVAVVAGKDLIAADLNGKSDPYFVLSCGHTQHKSSVVKKNLNPTWKEEVEVFPFNDEAALNIKVWDKDTLSKDDLIGLCKVTIREIAAAGAEGKWFPLEVPAELAKKKDSAGEIQLVVREMKPTEARGTVEIPAGDFPPDVTHAEDAVWAEALARDEDLKNPEAGGTSLVYVDRDAGTVEVRKKTDSVKDALVRRHGIASLRRVAVEGKGRLILAFGNVEKEDQGIASDGDLQVYKLSMAEDSVTKIWHALRLTFWRYGFGDMAYPFDSTRLPAPYLNPLTDEHRQTAMGKSAPLTAETAAKMRASAHLRAGSTDHTAALGPGVTSLIDNVTTVAGEKWIWEFAQSSATVSDEAKRRCVVAILNALAPLRLASRPDMLTVSSFRTTPLLIDLIRMLRPRSLELDLSQDSPGDVWKALARIVCPSDPAAELDGPSAAARPVRIKGMSIRNGASLDSTTEALHAALMQAPLSWVRVSNTNASEVLWRGLQKAVVDANSKLSLQQIIVLNGSKVEPKSFAELLTAVRADLWRLDLSGADQVPSEVLQPFVETGAGCRLQVLDARGVSRGADNFSALFALQFSPACYVTASEGTHNAASLQGMVASALSEPTILGGLVFDARRFDPEGMSPDALRDLMQQVATSGKFSVVRFAGAKFPQGSGYVDAVCQGLANCPTLIELDLNHTAFEQHITTVLGSCQNLRILRIAASPGSSPRSGPAIVPGQGLLQLCQTHPSLTELDITGYKVGTDLGIWLGETLRKNRVLRVVHWDDNGVGLEGYAAFRGCLYGNQKLLDIATPLDSAATRQHYKDSYKAECEREVAIRVRLKAACRVHDYARKESVLDELRECKRAQGRYQREEIKYEKLFGEVNTALDRNHTVYKAQVQTRLARQLPRQKIQKAKALLRELKRDMNKAQLKKLDPETTDLLLRAFTFAAENPDRVTDTYVADVARLIELRLGGATNPAVRRALRRLLLKADRFCKLTKCKTRAGKRRRRRGRKHKKKAADSGSEEEFEWSGSEGGSASSSEDESEFEEIDWEGLIDAELIAEMCELEGSDDEDSSDGGESSDDEGSDDAGSDGGSDGADAGSDGGSDGADASGDAAADADADAADAADGVDMYGGAGPYDPDVPDWGEDVDPYPSTIGVDCAAEPVLEVPTVPLSRTEQRQEDRIARRAIRRHNRVLKASKPSISVDRRNIALRTAIFESSLDFSVLPVLSFPHFASTQSSVTEAGDVTIVTQASVDRLPRLQQMASSWPGAISAAVYVPTWADPSSEEHRAEVEDARNAIGALVEEVRRAQPSCCLDIHLVCEDPDVPMPIDGRDKLYPINQLRNVALDFAMSDNVWLLDVDFVPSDFSYERIRAHAATLATPLSQPTAVVIPAFEVFGDIRAPRDHGSLKQLFDEGTCTGFHVGHFPQGHRATDFSRFFSLEGSFGQSYNVEYEECFEPYVVVRRALCPRYDERFRGYGHNKIQHLFSMHVEGFSFKVAADSFVVSEPHAPSASWTATFSRTPGERDPLQADWVKALYSRFRREQKAIGAQQSRVAQVA